MKLENLLAKARTKLTPKKGVQSCGGLLDQYGLFEQIQPKGTTEPCFVVMQKGKPIQYVTELTHGNTIYKPVKKLPWVLPNEPESYENEEQLWKNIRDCIHQHLDVESGYEILASWVMATWTLEKWRSVPYLFFYGALETGKTRALEILSALSFRGWLALYISPPNLYRPLEQWKPTLFLDEAEIYGDVREIIALLNGSYRRGQLVPRQVETPSGFQTVFFDCFGFKALAGTRKLAKTLESRCIIFKMSRATRKINLFINEEQTQKLRNQLLTWRFNKFRDESGEGAGFWKRVNYLADQLQSGRLTELIYPIYEISPTDNTKAVILQQALTIAQTRQEELGVSDEVIVLDAIMQAYNQVKMHKGTILIRDIANIVNEPLTPKEEWTNRRVSAIAQRIGFQKIRRRKGIAIKWSRSLLERLKKDLRYQSVFTSTPSENATSSPLSTPKPNKDWIDKAFRKDKN